MLLLDSSAFCRREGRMWRSTAVAGLGLVECFGMAAASTTRCLRHPVRERLGRTSATQALASGATSACNLGPQPNAFYWIVQSRPMYGSAVRYSGLQAHLGLRFRYDP